MSDGRSHKQVLVLRKDLNMRKGKMVAQGSHASFGAVVPRPTAEDIANGYLKVPLTEHNTAWLSGFFTKICVSVNSEDELVALAEKAASLGVPHYLITDNGLTEFKGVPTKTALAIGPAEISLVDQITAGLPLL